MVIVYNYSIGNIGRAVASDEERQEIQRAALSALSIYRYNYSSPNVGQSGRSSGLGPEKRWFESNHSDLQRNERKERKEIDEMFETSGT